MAVTAAQVKELRQATDAPMMDCKKALTECEGNMEKATEWLKERGVAKSAKKADRVAAEGSIGFKVSDDFKTASLVEINSETDFVAQNIEFKDLVSQTVAQVFDTQCSDAAALPETSKDGSTFLEYFQGAVSKIGEKIEYRRLSNIKADATSVVNGYVHSNTRIGVIVEISCDSEQTAAALAPVAKQVAMHASAMKPSTLSYKDFDATYVADETKGRIEAIKTENEERARLKKPLINVPEYISMCQLTSDVLAKAEDAIKATLKEQGKPEKIWDKIVPGQLARYIQDNTTLDKEQALLDQNYVLDDKMSVAQAVEAAGKAAGGTATIKSFIRLEVGEGLEKKVDNFAEEVAAQMA
ncbi:elongation factor Ts [Sulfurimonas sp. MAG313]|nr:translation elongation factor Ts [Sulfurimonas sp. MAG313]MDF1882279.1 elongation factor Ts [Sulfurimonas sp. MAG313]